MSRSDRRGDLPQLRVLQFRILQPLDLFQPGVKQRPSSGPAEWPLLQNRRQFDVCGFVGEFGGRHSLHATPTPARQWGKLDRHPSRSALREWGWPLQVGALFVPAGVAAFEQRGERRGRLPIPQADLKQSRQRLGNRVGLFGGQDHVQGVDRSRHRDIKHAEIPRQLCDLGLLVGFLEFGWQDLAQVFRSVNKHAIGRGSLRRFRSQVLRSLSQ